MRDMFSLIEKVVPQVGQELVQRLRIMKTLAQHPERIGRKTLAEEVALSERSLRTLMESLRFQGVVDVKQSGIRLTPIGLDVLEAMEQALDDHHEFFELAQGVKEKLGLQEVWIVKGDADIDPKVGSRLGRKVAEFLALNLEQGRHVLAMTGGTTLAQVAQEFTPQLGEGRDLVFVPARGGVGGSYDIQANNIGGLMAKQTDGQFVPLFIPENIGEQVSQVLLNNPSIRHAVELSKTANVLLLSVGNANIMAERHDLTATQKQLLKDQEAVGEAFGVFFNQSGQEVLRLPRFGIQFQSLREVPLLITVVGGASKARAVEAYYKLIQHHGVLICDEGIANMVLSGANTPLK